MMPLEEEIVLTAFACFAFAQLVAVVPIGFVSKPPQHIESHKRGGIGVVWVRVDLDQDRWSIAVRCLPTALEHFQLVIVGVALDERDRSQIEAERIQLPALNFDSPPLWIRGRLLEPCIVPALLAPAV